MTLVNVFSQDSDENICYEDFLSLVEKHGGEYGGHEFKFQQTASDKATTKGGVSREIMETI